MMADPHHCAARGTNRKLDEHNTLYGSLEVQRINKFLKGLAAGQNQTGARLDPVYHPDNSLYMIGEDACQPYKNCAHSTNLVFVK